MLSGLSKGRIDTRAFISSSVGGRTSVSRTFETFTLKGIGQDFSPFFTMSQSKVEGTKREDEMISEGCTDGVNYKSVYNNKEI